MTAQQQTNQRRAHAASVAAHTPGPWSAHLREDGPVDLLTPEWWCIDGPGSDVYGHMTAADACLISAAPDLLEALLYLRDCAESGELPSPKRWAQVQAAIQKAEGNP